MYGRLVGPRLGVMTLVGLVFGKRGGEGRGMDGCGCGFWWMGGLLWDGWMASRD